MRESLARRIALLIGTLVVALAAVFARMQNPPGASLPAPTVPTPAATPTPAPSPLVERGEQTYVDLGCARCHSIAGRGNPRLPLDGVGARSSEAEIRAWITPGASTPGSYRERHAGLGLPAEQRDALAAYLIGLRDSVISRAPPP